MTLAEREQLDMRYADNLAELKSAFPGQNLLTKKQVSDYTHQCFRYVTKTYPFRGNYISVATLARCLS